MNKKQFIISICLISLLSGLFVEALHSDEQTIEGTVTKQELRTIPKEIQTNTVYVEYKNTIKANFHSTNEPLTMSISPPPLPESGMIERNAIVITTKYQPILTLNTNGMWEIRFR